MHNLLFYKYVEIKDLDKFKKDHGAFCKDLGILGKILIATEGINGCVSGTKAQMDKYRAGLRKDKRFKDIEFKITKTNDHNFKKMVVRIRKEIVTSGFSVNLKYKANYIEPKELKNLLDKKKEVILLDARNDYESEVGKFENAITPPIETFSEFPKFVKKVQQFKNKKVVTYCTGGIRCEKASAYLKSQGFTDVQQLHGGIIRYGQECGNAHWEGKCFVFDNRGAIDIDPEHQAEPITQCVLCHIPTTDMHNCDYLPCDKRFICCKDCREILNHCCSKNCRNKLTKNFPSPRACEYCGSRSG